MCDCIDHIKNLKALYVSFDTYPAPKGAAVHIREFSGRLFEKFGGGLLLVLGDVSMPKWQIEDNIQIKRQFSSNSNFLQRAIEFGDFVYEQAKAIENNLQIAHFRDPWGGVPIICALKGKCPLVFEVNALPSIELPVRFSAITATTMNKIKTYEKFCLENSDAIVCPSNVIKENLLKLNVPETKITVIPNGADIEAFDKAIPNADAPSEYVIYVGAVQKWQGVEILFKAMTFLKDLPNFKLVMCVSGAKKRIKYLIKLAKLMELEDRIIWNIALPQNEVMSWLVGASLSVAPLVECERNLVQGCSPIKIIESMAAKKTVVASEMPVTKEILVHDKTGWLIPADRSSQLARAMRILMANPEKRRVLGESAYEYAKENLTWERALNTLESLYEKVVADHKININQTCLGE